MSRKQKGKHRKSSEKEKFVDKDPINKKSGSGEEPESKKETDIGDEKENDPEWYARDPQLLLDAGSIPFSDVFGSDMHILPKFGSQHYGDNISLLTDDIPADRVPGICTLKIAPTIGDSYDRTSPANVAATALYTHVRYVNSGRKNYDPCDLMMYCLTIADLYAYAMWMMRVYNCAYMFSQRNLYIGKALLRAQGVDAEDIVENLAKFRYNINVFLNKIASYAVPASCYLFKKRAFQFQNVYTESETGSIKDQLYMFVPHMFFRFQLDRYNRGSLQYSDPFDEDSMINTDGFRQFGENLLSQIWGDEDFGLMSGDILKAFNGDIVTISPLGEEGGIMPLYEPAVLLQFKNATVWGINLMSSWEQSHFYNTQTQGEIAPYNRGIFQDGYGNLVSRLAVLQNDIAPQRTKHLVNAWRDPTISIPVPVADPAITVEVTRYMGVKGTTVPKGTVMNSENVSDGYFGTRIDTCDTIVIRAEWITIDPNDEWGVEFQEFNTNIIGDVVTYKQVKAIGSFHYFPLMFIDSVVTLDDYRTKVNEIYCVSDLNNYTVQKAAVVQRLHELSLLSLLYVPGVAKQINYNS